MSQGKTKASTPDDTLVRLNVSIENVLKQFLPTGVAVRFDLPDVEEKPAEPTVSVFLYDIQEDLQLRHGEVRQYSPIDKVLLPGHVHVRCCYLITYWDSAQGKSADAPSAAADSQAVMAMNAVLNALLNNRILKELPASYTRVIPPSEQLNSLGNFWQALGNKPRLSLSYAVTVPITLLAPGEAVFPIKSIEETLQEKAGSAEETDAAIGPALWNVLYAQLRAAAPDDAMLRLHLAKLGVTCKRVDTDDSKLTVAVSLDGLATKELIAKIPVVTEKWKSAQAVCVVNGEDVYVEKVTSGLTEV